MPQEKTKSTAGRPKKKIDADQVRKMARYGATINEIADILSVDRSTITRRFKSELAQGKADLRLRLRKAQIQTAIEDRNPTMLVWLGKQMLNQSDNGTFEEDELLSDVEFELDGDDDVHG